MRELRPRMTINSSILLRTLRLSSKTKHLIKVAQLKLRIVKSLSLYKHQISLRLNMSFHSEFCRSRPLKMKNQVNRLSQLIRLPLVLKISKSSKKSKELIYTEPQCLLINSSRHWGLPVEAKTGMKLFKTIDVSQLGLYRTRRIFPVKTVAIIS